MVLQELNIMETWKMACPHRKFQYLKLHRKMKIHNFSVTDNTHHYTG